MMEEWLLLKDGGICRCCALEGPSKDLVSKYSWMGDDEIYSDMLRECFNITLVTVEEGSNGGICEVCITQLRSAYKFRQHVLHTEEQFKKKLESKILCDSAFVKLEIPPETSDTDMDPMGDNDDNSDYEVPLKKIKDELESEMELMKQKKTPAKTIASKSTRTLKKKASVEPETSKRKPGSPTIKIESPEIDEEKEQILKTQAMNCKNRKNLKVVLLNSNATVFRTTGLHFACAYCSEVADKAHVIKTHTYTNHDKEKLKYKKESQRHDQPTDFYAKVDITNLNCNACSEAQTTLHDLSAHLKSKHNIDLPIDADNRLMEFRFDTDLYNCVVCSKSHLSILALTKHAKVHYTSFVCEECGNRFFTKKSLRIHKYRHKPGEYECKYCGEIFDRQWKRNSHKEMHEKPKEKFKCPFCPKRFRLIGEKKRHITNDHKKEMPMLSCRACDKKYTTQFELTRHTKREHLMERKHKCGECEKSFFTAAMLRKHSVVHTGVKAFQCDVCLKRFNRRCTLREHIRIHENDRRFACTQCEQRFVQKCSLKGHMLSRHGEGLI